MGAGCCDNKAFGEPCADCAFDEPVAHPSGSDLGRAVSSSRGGAGGLDGAGCCDNLPFGEPCGDCAFDEPADLASGSRGQPTGWEARTRLNSGSMPHPSVRAPLGSGFERTRGRDRSPPEHVADAWGDLRDSATWDLGTAGRSAEPPVWRVGGASPGSGHWSLPPPPEYVTEDIRKLAKKLDARMAEETEWKKYWGWCFCTDEHYYDRHSGMCYQVTSCRGSKCYPPLVRLSHYPCSEPPPKWWEGLPPCPEDESKTKKQEYTSDSSRHYGLAARAGSRMWCGGPADQDYHPGAETCYRQAVYTSIMGQPGQQCCYDKNGKLITEGAAAGTPDKQAVARAVDENGKCDRSLRAALSHYSDDVKPWLELRSEARRRARDLGLAGAGSIWGASDLTEEWIHSEVTKKYQKTHPPWGSKEWEKQGGQKK